LEIANLRAFTLDIKLLCSFLRRNRVGAVGLNFGSATSGQGFDVASTVNQIVTNLQAVETPWKTQLTNLQARDTALSSLGTQLSTLSADLQALTDFQGTMAEKSGSSSDTSVLQLLSATATAVAGTHTVEVENLARTSSAASDAIGAADVLAGSITFKVGNGEWRTVSVGDYSTASTIAGLSAAINAAGLDVQASVMTNADGSQRLSLVSRLTGSAGQITISDATSLTDTTDPEAPANLGLKTVQDGVDASMIVDGVQVTSASNTVTNAIPGVTFQLLSTGSTTSSSGTATSESVQVIIANDTSSIESAVNKFVSDYNSVMKAITGQEGKDSEGNSLPLYGSPVMAQLQQGLQSALSSTFGTGAIKSLISLGITASAAADGTISLNLDTLSNALDNNFAEVVSFFQDSDKFGSAFSKVLDNLGNTHLNRGVITLALKEDSAQESALKDNIEKQEALIAIQKERLTAELDEMYSAITGYNRKNG
jgi:flagellar hook-associated protein 2